jgi:hypothetical protein
LNEKFFILSLDSEDPYKEYGMATCHIVQRPRSGSGEPAEKSINREDAASVEKLRTTFHTLIKRGISVGANERS